jgi:polysaccharide biosynthesis protein PslH
MRMKILWVKAGGLVPPDTGGKIRSYNIVRELARAHSVTLVSFHAEQPDDRHPQLNELFDHVVSIPLKLPAPKGITEFFAYARNLLLREPYGIAKYCRSEVRQKLRRLLREHRFDVIVCDFVIAAGAIPWDVPSPKVIFTHNVEAVIWKRHYEVARNPLWKALSWLEWKKMQAAENKYLQLADQVLTVSENDRAEFSSFLERTRLTVIPTGVDTQFFQPAPAPEQADSLVFTGSMDWLPNEDAILYFAEQILPSIRAQVPGVSLSVIGRKPSRRLQELAARESRIQLTGWVEDVRPHLARGAVCVVPLRIGGGTRLKIFEAMAMGKAVVSTSIGAEGLPVRDDENILIRDEPSAFANAAVSLLKDPARRARLGRKARALVEENYSWRQVAKGFAAVLANVTGNQNWEEEVARTSA